MGHLINHWQENEALRDGTEPSICVVIPTLNEADSISATLDALNAQSALPEQIVIADAGSADRTAEIGRAWGCRIVPGGLPGVGRNNGARETDAGWILFLDADVTVPAHGIADAMTTAEKDRLDALSCWFVPDVTGWPVRFTHWLSAAYFWLSTRLGWAHSIGGFMLVRRQVHEAIGGFDETVLVAEDQDYALRISRVGRYAFVRRPAVVISARRFRSDGLFRASARWIGIEFHRMLLGEVRRPFFRYFE